MPQDPARTMQEAIRLWSGIARPNDIAEKTLGDFPALIAEIEVLRSAMLFEDEPSGFELALRDEAEKDA